jgi:hypothetical protein
MDDGGRAHLLDQSGDVLTVSNIKLVMNEPCDLAHQAPLVEASVALSTEDHRPLIVVNAMNREPLRRKVHASFRADEARGAGDEDRFQG